MLKRKWPPNPNNTLTLMTKDILLNTGWNTINKVNVTYFFWYRKG